MCIFSCVSVCVCVCVCVCVHGVCVDAGIVLCYGVCVCVCVCVCVWPLRLVHREQLLNYSKHLLIA